MEFRFDRAQPGNTFDAHRLVHLASVHGMQDAMKERLLAAYLTEGAPIGDPETLVALAGDVGLDRDEARVRSCSATATPMTCGPRNATRCRSESPGSRSS